MSTITAPLPQASGSPLGARLTPVAYRSKRALHQLRRWHEGFDSDRHTSLSELTLRSNPADRFRR